MPASLSIRAVPDALVEKLLHRAAGKQRLLQREPMAIVEAAVELVPRAIPATRLPAAAAQRLGAHTVFSENRAHGRDYGGVTDQTRLPGPAVRVSTQLIQR